MLQGYKSIKCAIIKSRKIMAAPVKTLRGLSTYHMISNMATNVPASMTSLSSAKLKFCSFCTSQSAFVKAAEEHRIWHIWCGQEVTFCLYFTFNFNLTTCFIRMKIRHVDTFVTCHINHYSTIYHYHCMSSIVYT